MVFFVVCMGVIEARDHHEQAVANLEEFQEKWHSRTFDLHMTLKPSMSGN
jgi:hypothetical protein